MALKVYRSVAERAERFLSECQSDSSGSALGVVVLVPVTGDINAAAEPHAIVFLHIV